MMISEKELKDFEELVMKKLKGKFKHYCHDWDMMAIDETCPEFEACTCYSKEEIYNEPY